MTELIIRRTIFAIIFIYISSFFICGFSLWIGENPLTYLPINVMVCVPVMLIAIHFDVVEMGKEAKR